jgi:hypothetical protein
MNSEEMEESSRGSIDAVSQCSQKRLKKAIRHLSHNSLCPGQNSNQAHSVIVMPVRSENFVNVLKNNFQENI